MGGCYWLKDPTVRDWEDEMEDEEEDQDEAQEETLAGAESQVKNEGEEDGDQDMKEEEEEEEEIAWTYRYSFFHYFKGQILRAIIAHLEGLLSEENPTLETFSKAGVAYKKYKDIGKKTRLSEEKSLKSAKAIVKEALTICQGWVRNPKGDVGPDALLKSLFSGSAASLGGLDGFPGRLGGGMRAPEDIMDLNYRSTEVQKAQCCPLPLYLAGLRGLYDLLLWSDNAQIVYPDEAKRIVNIVDKALVYLKADLDEEDVKEMAREVRQMMVKCDGVKYVA
ncbi:hypothetical protein PQX77_004245 [Marasmius sp. AFHP31]|nr:hypothetical protein PQX77_004245 [Marasmius sp. AFHP31]